MWKKPDTQEYDSLCVKFKNRQNYCMMLEVRIVITSWGGRNLWEAKITLHLALGGSYSGMCTCKIHWVVHTGSALSKHFNICNVIPQFEKPYAGCWLGQQVRCVHCHVSLQPPGQAGKSGWWDLAAGGFCHPVVGMGVVREAPTGLAAGELSTISSLDAAHPS